MRLALPFLLATATVSGVLAAGGVSPSPAKIPALQKLAREAGAAAFTDLDSAGDHVKRVRWLATDPGAGAPAERARAFLQRHREAFGVMSQNRTLVEVLTQDGLTGHHVRFQQTIGGLPVHDAFVGVDVDRAGRVRGVANDSQPHLELATGVRSVTATDAVSIALRLLSIQGSFRGKVATQEVAFASAGVARPAWRVTVPAYKPRGDWEVLVDEIDRKVLSKRDRLCYADGTGRVFDPNPVVVLKNTSLRDQNDLDSAVPDAAYSIVALHGLDGTGLLRGQFVDCFSATAASQSGTPGPMTRANEPSLQFLYRRSDRRFEETMAYYHLDSLQRFIQSDLGFPNVMNRRISINAHAFPEDNSFYSPDTKSISYGEGGVDDAEDADVIRHEYGHAIHDDQVPGWGASAQSRAMGEGWGDALAVLSFAATGQTFNVPVVADWDATAYSGANPPNLRRVDGTKVYPRDVVNEAHADGEIWSGAIFRCRNLLGGAGVGDRLMLRLLIQSHFSLTPSASFADGANAILAADADLNSGTNIATLRGVFAERGLLPASTAPVISAATPRSGINRSAVDIQVTGFGFTGATAVSLAAPGSPALTPIQVLDDGHILAHVPAGIAAGSYAIVVAGANGTGSGPGRFHVDDHPDSAAEVTLQERILPNGSLSGNIGDGKDTDWFAFPAKAGGSYTLAVAAPNDLDTVLTVYGLDGTTELATNDDISTSNRNSRIDGFTPAQSGNYFLKVNGYDGGVTGPYGVSVTGPGGTDLLVNSFTTSAAITGGQPVSLQIDLRNVGDQAAGPFDVSVTLTPLAGGPSRVLYTTRIAGLAGGASSILSVSTAALPELLVPGGYRLDLAVDTGAAVAELDERNNSRTLGSVPLVSPRPASSFFLDLQQGLNAIALVQVPFTASGSAYTAADLAIGLGATFVARIVAGPPGADSRFEIFTPGGATAPFAIEGNQGYLVSVPAPETLALQGMPWPAGSEVLQVRKGLNLIAYPFGVPSTEGAQQLLDRTLGIFFASTADNTVLDERFKSVLPTVAAKPGEALKAGRGYVILVPRPPANAIRLPIP
ncbi:MAG: M36 family metallopeptidase [Candidatus Wallbacteria bacterium]|nr:M36 family metallopeptidase [Candidatus Wallbacteria bacterium]